MNPHAHLSQFAHGGRHIDCVSAKAIHLGDNQNVVMLQSVKQPHKAGTLLNGRTAGDSLGHNAPAVHVCQIACNRDPLFAPNCDPLTA